MNITFEQESVKTKIPDETPLVGSLLVGFIASLCCGGSLVFGAIGLGAFYGSLRMSRYIPEALAAGAVLIGLLNWLYYNRKFVKSQTTEMCCNLANLRSTMVISTFLGLVLMASTFLFFEWLNHAIVNSERFMVRPDFANTIIPGVRNQRLLIVAATFLILPVVGFLPFSKKIINTDSQKT